MMLFHDCIFLCCKYLLLFMVILSTCLTFVVKVLREIDGELNPFFSLNAVGGYNNPTVFEVTPSLADSLTFAFEPLSLRFVL
jgi:hypothetical protein